MRRRLSLICIVGLVSIVLAIVACAPAAAPAPAPGAPAAPAAAKQPAAPAAAAAPQAPAAPAPTAAPAGAPTPTASAKLTPKRGGTLTLLGSAAISGGWDPYLNSTQGLKTLSCCYLKLLKGELGESGIFGDPIYKPYLAESWDIAPDGKSITFHLRKGVKWAPLPPLNGREVTAEDVKYSYDRLAFDTKSVVRGAFISLATVEVVDKYTVKFVGTSPTSLLIINALQHPGWIIPREIVERDGNISFVTIGAGPFYLAKDVKGVGWTLARNENFLDASKPYVDEVKLLLILDKSAQMAAFRAGQLDVFGGTIKDMKAVVKTNPQTQAFNLRQGSTNFFAFKADEPDKPWADKRVRLAVSKALDRDAMLQALNEGDGDWGGAMEEGYQPYALTMAEKRKIYTLQYDLAAARQLMKEAGYPNGFKATSNYTEVLPVSPYLIVAKQMLKENINVDLDLVAREYSAFLAQGWPGVYTESIAFSLGGTGTWFNTMYFEFHSKGKWPTSKIKAPELDKMIDDAFATLDKEAQVKKVKDIQYYILNDLGYHIAMPGGNSHEMQQPWVKDYRYNAWDYTQYFIEAWISK